MLAAVSRHPARKTAHCGHQPRCLDVPAGHCCRGSRQGALKRPRAHAKPRQQAIFRHKSCNLPPRRSPEQPLRQSSRSLGQARFTERTPEQPQSESVRRRGEDSESVAAASSSSGVACGMGGWLWDPPAAPELSIKRLPCPQSPLNTQLKRHYDSEQPVSTVTIT